MHRVLTAACLALLVAAVSACGDGPDEPVPTPIAEGTYEPVPGLPVLGPAAQDLEFIGVVEGRMTEASTTCTWIRGATPGSDRFQASFDGLVDGKRHRLRIVVHGYSGPGPYAWDGVPGSGPEVTIELDSNQKGHATVNVDSPGGSGDMEATLTTPNVGRIHGIWECAGTPR